MNTGIIFAASLALSITCTTVVQAKFIAVSPGPDAQEKLQEALIEAETGDTVLLGTGTYVLTDGLSLDVDGVTIRGSGMDSSILSFANQQGAGEGLLVTSDRVLLIDFAVEDAKGDGIKAKGVDQITFKNVRVEWTGEPKTENGAYAIYPVEARNVLIEDSVAIGASDAGIYVGQSQNIVVRRNRAERNVAGIEIENSFHADVYENVATHNTGGILVFDLPNLKQMGGHTIRVFNNQITDNDQPNFAEKGTTVADVPMGTGVLVMANRNVHVFNNSFDNNAMVHVAVVSYFNDYEDDGFFPHPRGVYIYDNDYGKGGYEPTGDVGQFFAEASGNDLPDILWDGVVPISEWLSWTKAGDGIYIDEKDDTSFANLKMVSQTIFPWGAAPDRDKSGYAATDRPDVEPVALPQD